LNIDLKKLQEFIDTYSEPGHTLKADGLDSAIIGIDNGHRIVYDIHKILKILKNDMTEEEAIEHFYYNIAGAYVGEYTPVFIWTYKELGYEPSIN